MTGDLTMVAAGSRVADRLSALEKEITQCRACPRLVEWRERMAREKRASFRDETYWGRAVPGFGDPRAGMLVVGLAPAAHGANRTGRPFTGDRSGDWLYAALHRAGFANQAESVSGTDGLELVGARVIAAVRCAPPANKPTPAERDRCNPFMAREVALLPALKVVVALGAFAFRAVLDVWREMGATLPKPAPRFGHGAEFSLPAGPGGGPAAKLISSYHPSPRNTFTGTLTEEMFDAVWSRARALVGPAA